MDLSAVIVHTAVTVHVSCANLLEVAGLVEALRVGTLVVLFDGIEKLAAFTVTQEMQDGASAIVQQAFAERAAA